jgi:cell wall-associated NlpC family hydrolase/LysM repeat protein
MPIKNLTLGLCLVLSGSALAQHQTYRIKEGDTLSGIAERFSVRTHAIVKANGLDRKTTLKVGRVLTIPSATVSSDRHQAVSVPSAKGGYTVRKGDHDEVIAKRLGLTTRQLHLLNPGVNWRALQLGQALRVSTKGRVEATVAKKQATKKVSSSTGYVVRNGENDWIIAHRLGVTTVALKRLNPGVNLAQLRVGQSIRVPGSAVAKAATPKLRSRYAVIGGDAVTIRREPSRSADAITQVDAGTRVVVLDRDGDWYRLRFPKGTEGWVRGDLLKAASAPRVAERPRRASAERETRVAAAPRRHKKTEVASRTRRAHAEPVAQQEFTQDVVAYENSEKPVTSKILQKAQTFRGVRYRWGAMSRSATDCSGFTSQVFKSQGYKIPRTSREQATAGIPVHAKDLKEGDLVFFHTRRGARVTHVGIYMGNGKFIHASSGGGKVQVNSLSDGYYKKRLVAARRVAKPSPKSSSHSTKVAKKADPIVATPPTTPDTHPAISTGSTGDEK